MLYLENIRAARDVIGFNDAGDLQIESFYRTDGWDITDEPGTFHCEGCHHEWPQTDEEIDFV